MLSRQFNCITINEITHQTLQIAFFSELQNVDIAQYSSWGPDSVKEFMVLTWHINLDGVRILFQWLLQQAQNPIRQRQQLLSSLIIKQNESPSAISLGKYTKQLFLFISWKSSIHVIVVQRQCLTIKIIYVTPSFSQASD